MKLRRCIAQRASTGCILKQILFFFQFFKLYQSHERCYEKNDKAIDFMTEASRKSRKEHPQVAD
jgi:hypothetical protein